VRDQGPWSFVILTLLIGTTFAAVSAQRGAEPGGTSDRKFHAFDAATGKLLWEFSMNSGALAPPSSFSVDGKQYVAVETGWGGDSRGMQATLNNLFPGEYPEVPEGGAVWVFALE
jgi:alcohol dehydrogenase (cytochrome c)